MQTPHAAPIPLASAVHRKLSTLAGKWGGVGDRAHCGLYSYCIGPYSFGWAVKGFDPTVDPKHNSSVSASLHIEPWESEPDTRSGKKPEALMGTVTATGLTTGAAYDVYRWDTVADAFTYSDQYKKASFIAANSTHVYADDTSFLSNGTTYYRVVQAS
jgi:hypothetical protein